MVAIPVSSAANWTISPPGGAGEAKLTVSVPGLPNRFNGSGDNVMISAPAVMVTVAGALLVNGSLTIN